MNEQNSTPYGTIDDYIAVLPAEEQREVTIAGLALDLAYILHQARQARGLSQVAAARQAGMHQQAISRFETATGTMQLATLQRYLNALGYSIDLLIKDNATGEVVGQTTFSAT